MRRGRRNALRVSTVFQLKKCFKKCFNFGKENHLKSKCKQKNAKSSTHKLQKKVHAVRDTDCSSEEEILCVELNDVNTEYKSKVYATMEINGKSVKMQIDSGASCNVLPKKLLSEDAEIVSSDQKLSTYCKSILPVLGVAKVSFRNVKNRRKYRTEFAIGDGDYQPLIGAKAA